MIKFYKLAKIQEPDGSTRIDFFREEGYFLPNNFALEAAVYRSENKFWYVVELTSGSGLAQGATRNKAVANFESTVNRAGLKSIEAAIKRSIELYGKTPDHRETEVF